MDSIISIYKVLNKIMIHFKKKFKLKNDIIISFFISLFFVLFTILLPVYDNVNGFHNLIFDYYNLMWYDGRSPANFHIIKNLLEHRSISFPKGYLIGNVPVENNVDFVEKNGQYYPSYSFFGNYIYATILFPFSFFSDIFLFKIIILLNILFFAITLVIFYYIQKLLGLKTNLCFVSTIITGLATYFLIYSRYLFIGGEFITIFFLLILYIILRNEKTYMKKDIFLSSFLSIFLIFTWYPLAILYFYIILSYFIIKNKLVKSSKIYLGITISSIILFLLFYSDYYNLISPKNFIANTHSNFLIDFFSHYINALDFITYCYHNTTSVWKLERDCPHIFYTFMEQPGNAIFIKSYGLFASLFGPRGIIYNSPFLIFSIFGITSYKNQKRKFILIPLLMFIFAYGFFTPSWHGGVTPRYVRFFAVPILLLSFFSFYYIQVSKNVWAKIIFIFLIIISVLNVTSLAIRADWTYEHEANLVSYDLVLWPWYPPSPQENIINLYLTEQGQSVEWSLGGESSCKAYGTLEGIVTPVCNCEYITYAERNIEIPWEKIMINITACNSNSDGIIGKFYFDRIEKDIFIQPNSCKKESIKIYNSTGKHSFVIKSKRHDECIDEPVIWKLITIEKN